MGDECSESKKKIMWEQILGGGEVLVEFRTQTECGEKLFGGGAI